MSSSGKEVTLKILFIVGIWSIKSPKKNQNCYRLAKQQQLLLRRIFLNKKNPLSFFQSLWLFQCWARLQVQAVYATKATLLHLGLPLFPKLRDTVFLFPHINQKLCHSYQPHTTTTKQAQASFFLPSFNINCFAVCSFALMEIDE